MRALFLDRDGVINREKKDSYIFNSTEFHFYEGAEEALAKLSHLFDYLIIVTNQRGVGRGLMTVGQLDEIHDYLKKAIEHLGGKIDAIYFAPQIETDHPQRKPNIGMALEAKKDFPDIDFSESIMAGNNLTDMKFGKNIGMKTIFIASTQKRFPLPHPLIDSQFDSLKNWSDSL